MKLLDIISKNIILTKEHIQFDSELTKEIQSRVGVTDDGIWGLQTDAAVAFFCDSHNLNNDQTGLFGAFFASALLSGESGLLTKEQAISIFENSVSAPTLLDLNNCLQRFAINSKPRMTHFLSQVAHESGGLMYTKELASGAAYEGRQDLGNCKPGDGCLFRGCGFIQVTGRYWHTEFSKYIGDPKIISLGTAYTSEKYPASISGFWWMRNKMNGLCDRNPTIEEVTRRVNGGLAGIDSRKHYYALACKFIEKNQQN